MSKPRVRVRFNNETRRWYAVVLDADGEERRHREPGRSPEGSEADAEAHMENWKRFGAWLKS